MQRGQQLLVSLATLLAAILLLGLLRREKHGIAGIGFESFFILLVYAGVILIFFLK